MNIRDIISKKAAGEELSFEELSFFIRGLSDGSITDYQTSALLAAIYINGMNDRETTDLTLLMAESGDKMDLSEIPLSLDKHSSGGVGDKVSLIIAPVISALGITVAKMSGRGLSHTGGTIDKLEAIEGFNVNLSNEEYLRILKKNGCGITSQTGNLCVADKKMYALRDVTGLVDSIPLIASSIMSKKIASGAEHIILDVKCGSGAFMNTEEDAVLLSEKMVTIGKSLGRKIMAMVTDMNEPLGYAVGNSVEVIEAAYVLKGEYVKGLSELCEEICINALLITNQEEDKEIARSKVREVIKDGSAYLKFEEFIKEQGGNPDLSKLPLENEYTVYSDKEGYIKRIDCKGAGELAMALGGGRMKKDDKINYGVGLVFKKKTGDFIKKGEPILTVYSKNEPESEKFMKLFEFSDNTTHTNDIIKREIW